MLEKIINFFWMDGYGIYVWPAYSVTFLILFWQLIIPLKQNHKISKKTNNHE